MNKYVTSKANRTAAKIDIDDFLPFHEGFDASEIMPKADSNKKLRINTIPDKFQICGSNFINEFSTVVMMVMRRNANAAIEYIIHGSLYSRDIVFDLTKKAMQV